MISWVCTLSSVMPWVSTQYLSTCETVPFTCCCKSLRETFLNTVDSTQGLVDRWWSPRVPGKKVFQIISFTALCSKPPLAFVPSCIWSPRNPWLSSLLILSHSLVFSSSPLFLWSHKPPPKPPYSQQLLLILWTFSVHWQPGSWDFETGGESGEASPFTLFIKVFLWKIVQVQVYSLVLLLLGDASQKQKFYRSSCPFPNVHI